MHLLPFIESNDRTAPHSLISHSKPRLPLVQSCPRACGHIVTPLGGLILSWDSSARARIVHLRLLLVPDKVLFPRVPDTCHLLPLAAPSGPHNNGDMVSNGISMTSPLLNGYAFDFVRVRTDRLL